MAVTIEIANKQKRIPLCPPEITRIVKKVLEFLGIPQARLSIVFVTDSQIQRLNKHFLKRDWATDVLAFDLKETERESADGPAAPGLDGEIVVSSTTAVRQSRLYGFSPYQELILYVVHGILHLSGYDDHPSSAKRSMRRKEQEVMQHLFPGQNPTPNKSR